MIARGEDPAVTVICEEPDWVAFFPLRPATRGHTLIIPRSHFRDLWSVDAAVATELTAAVLRVGRAVARVVEPEGMNLISSSGQAAEQTIFHLHLHVVPRWETDGFGDIWPPADCSHGEADRDLGARIRAECVSIGRDT